MSPSTSSASERCARFSRRPVANESSTRTGCPSSRRRSTRWDPMNPPPPMTRTRIGGRVAGTRRVEARLPTRIRELRNNSWSLGSDTVEVPWPGDGRPASCCRRVSANDDGVHTMSLNGHGSWERVLVTGGAGFVGSHLVDALVARGSNVVILDDLSTGRQANLHGLADSSRVELVEGSTLDERL